MSLYPTYHGFWTGSVVNVSSIAGLRYHGKPEVAHSAAKAAVTQFTKYTACALS